MTASMDKEAPTMESMRWMGVDVHAVSGRGVGPGDWGDQYTEDQGPTRASRTRVAGYGGAALPGCTREDQLHVAPDSN